MIRNFPEIYLLLFHALHSAPHIEVMIPKFLIIRSASSNFKTLKNPKSQLTHLNFLSSIASQRQKDRNFTISYLITSCGLSPETAARVSKQVHFENPDKPNAVLTVLRNYGFSETLIAEFVQKRPSLLLTNAEKILLPKLEFFKSIGLPLKDLSKMAVKNQSLLYRSLENCLIPRYNALKSVVHDDGVIVRVLKHGALPFLFFDVANNLVPNVEYLKQVGVSQGSISHMVMFHTRQAFMKNELFVEGVKLAIEMRFDPSTITFVNAVSALLHMDEGKMESKILALEKWGWSKEVTLSAFRKYPTFLSYSEERIDKTMSFLVEDMGWHSEDVARFPTAMGYSLEKRIVPRCHVIKTLKLKGLIKSQLTLSIFMCVREDVFLANFVNKFLDEVPLLMKVYQGLIDYKDVL